MWKVVLVLGTVAALVVGFVTFILGVGTTDDDGRVRMPGRAVLTLDEGEYGVWYEEPIETNSNETFEAPDGIRMRVRALRGARKPKLDLGGIGSQVGTDNKTAESIGSLEVFERGRYRVVVGRSPQATRASITLGDRPRDTFVRALERAGYIMAGTAALTLVLLVVSRMRRSTFG